MDWLLSSRPMPIKKSSVHEFPSLLRSLPGTNSTATSSGSNKKKRKRTRPTQGDALLSQLHAMTGRESRKPGLGTRLFVQACVLSGCDYAPSQLSGVGLVNAFKLVMENAFRDDEERFARLLKSLPKSKILACDGEKKSRNLASDIIENYVELLAKSEAVFYYHRVVDVVTGNIVPLISSPTTGGIKQYSPSLVRFPNDSFIGSEKMESRSTEALLRNKSEVIPSVKASPFFKKAFPTRISLDTDVSSHSQSSRDETISQISNRRDNTMKSILHAAVDKWWWWCT